VTDLLFLARLAKGDVMVLTRLCARDAFSYEELQELAKFLRLRQDAATAQRAVDLSLRRLEKRR
jgi:hypothetical protein